MTAYLEAGFPAAQAAAEAARGGEPPAVQAAPVAVDPLVEELVRAGLCFEPVAVSAIIRKVSGERGWEIALPAVIFPALVALGEGWARNEVSAAQEHFLSECVRAELLAASADLPLPSADRPLVLLACPEGERHDIGLQALKLFLLKESLRVLYLGIDLPQAALLNAIVATRPAAVCLAATGASAAASLGRAARLLAAQRPPQLTFLGGPAVHLAGAPGRLLSDDVRASARQIAAAVG